MYREEDRERKMEIQRHTEIYRDAVREEIQEYRNMSYRNSNSDTHCSLSTLGG